MMRALVLAGLLAVAAPARAAQSIPTALELRWTAPASGVELGVRAAPPALANGRTAWSAGIAGGTRAGDANSSRIELGGRFDVALAASTGAWLGAGYERRERGSTILHAPVLQGGLRTRRVGVDLAVRVRHAWRERPGEPIQVWSWTSPDHFQSPPDVFPTLPYWEHGPPELVGVQLLELGGGWTRGAWRLEAAGGMQIASGLTPTPQLTLSALRWVRPDVGIVLGARSATEAWLADDYDGTARVELGVRLEPGRRRRAQSPPAEAGVAEATWTIEKLADGRHRVRVCGAAGRVFLRGDFTEWAEVALAPDQSGCRTAAWRLEPGVHRFETRLDGGAWGPPGEGLASAGEYGSAAGTLVVE